MPLLDLSRWRPVFYWLLVCSLGLNSGCARQPKFEDPDKVVEVRGAVYYKGRPVSGAHLTFHRDTPGESAFAISDDRGTYTAMTNDTSGLYPGDYHITVSHSKLPLAKRYADPELSPLVLTVSDDEARQEFLVHLED